MVLNHIKQSLVSIVTRYASNFVFPSLIGTLLSISSSALE